MDDKSLSNIFDPFLRSPTLPSEPAPAYSALPHRDQDFYLVPLLNDRVGDVELETVDGLRFLVHKKLLESETVFFHIYYGFIPLWRLGTIQQEARDQQNGSGSLGLNNLFCIPKIIANTFSRSTGTNSTNHSNSTTSTSHSPSNDAVPPAVLNDGTTAHPTTPPPPVSPLLAEHLSRAHSTNVNSRVNGHQNSTTRSACALSDLPPPPPPKDPVSAPTPTINPYTWAVPETSAVLEAFLFLIYPPGSFSPSPASQMTNLDMVGKVIRAALGYQSSKALNAARDRLASFLFTYPLDVYAMSSFFKFADLARIASGPASGIPISEWSTETRTLMGSTAANKLEDLQRRRMLALREVLERNELGEDEHSAICVRRPMAEILWDATKRQVIAKLRPDSELLELLNVDVRGGHCGDCLLQLGATARECMLQAREIPKTI